MGPKTHSRRRRPQENAEKTVMNAIAKIQVKAAIVAYAASALWTAVPAAALRFPESCRTPSATVTQITVVDTGNERMEARYTLPDIIFAVMMVMLVKVLMPADECISQLRGELLDFATASR